MIISRFGQILAIVFMLLIILVMGAAFLNIPFWVKHNGMPFYLAFLLAQGSLIGIGLTFYGIYLALIEPLMTQMRVTKLRNNSGQKPWELNKQWKRKKVVHTNLGKSLFLLIFVLNWWSAMIFFATDRGADIIDQPIAVILLCLILIIIGFIMLRLAIITSINWLRFGKSFLIIETLPGKPGGYFKAKIRTGFDKKTGQPVMLTLMATERYWFWHNRWDSSQDFQQSLDTRETTPLWVEEVKIPVRDLILHDKQLSIPVCVSIPENAVESGPSSPSSEILWKLKVRFLGQKDPNYQAEFQIPIFNAN
ncbi:hypothetical protein [Lentilitoribacter sp. Alg239-R112]|uniref:hypothetical protein n=1 Tax=Lentilitoribacter sp. Alg239-R112 TaxID=2305987 RepID=UPI0013A6BC1B|nr:hypothetical protein [Lentilitoribacter sp. Alg239-R112]